MAYGSFFNVFSMFCKQNPLCHSLHSQYSSYNWFANSKLNLPFHVIWLCIELIWIFFLRYNAIQKENHCWWSDYRQLRHSIYDKFNFQLLLWSTFYLFSCYIHLKMTLSYYVNVCVCLSARVRVCKLKKCMPQENVVKNMFYLCTMNG